MQVMLDSPITLPWDVSNEMGGYVSKLAHVSTECRLSAEEELIVLKNCICDPADARFEPKRHSVHQVLLCKNRRSELRARHSWHIGSVKVGAVPECDVELPPRPAEDSWIYHWTPAAIQVGEAQLEELLQSLTIEFKSSSTLYADEMHAIIGSMNDLPQSGTKRLDLADKGMFLLLYGLFQGSIGVRNGVSTEPFGVSFATLLLGLMCSGLQQDSILSSILHTLARVHALGPFMPEWQDLRPSSQRRNDRFFGMPTNDEVESSLGRLLGTVLVEMRSLTGTPRAIREVTRKMVNRRSEVLTKELMYGGGTDSVDAGWGGWGGGGGISFGGGTFGPKRAMEDVAEEADQQIELEVSQLAQLRVLKKTGTAKPADCTPAVDERVPGNELEGCELTQVLRMLALLTPPTF